VVHSDFGVWHKIKPVPAQDKTALAQDQKISQAFDFIDVYTFGTGWHRIKRL
jgi:hypothetical protein